MCIRDRYKDKWDEITRKMGYWVDLNDPYITFKNEYIETLWWLLSELYKKGLLYESVSIQPYSPAAGTGLSSHELNQPGTYRMVKDTSAVAQFRVKREPKADFLFSKTAMDVYILAWTTTPWTLPSNCALAVGKKIEYVLVETYNPCLLYTSYQHSEHFANNFSIPIRRQSEVMLPFSLCLQVILQFRHSNLTQWIWCSCEFEFFRN